VNTHIGLALVLPNRKDLRYLKPSMAHWPWLYPFSYVFTNDIDFFFFMKVCVMFQVRNPGQEVEIRVKEGRNR
jgi:hypothetical protein